ncbi:precorrin-3B C(17)-methyltransferase [Sulfodiicoccus acidiphilus]|uniref:Precorrin-3B C(17)-methyltransferase n=1 Tax=Sulfodiicoccus acidiphilus TaxID=1670455 RepID=A0A348B2N3_9CREN|nr:precorrin-3B C(17)-methyltransferase [Sulfodiicoccus acidiphilus]BBD72435.1 precorrin-3B C(17)-methyltransferase [Sulfodiicoccus acidiphilus]GGT97151.1 precorrin-3B C(17)-methyltransferase [Sulfodiicoccus acidiphilus]
MKRGKIYLLGTGPGSPDLRTLRTVEALKESDVVVTYRTYAQLIGDLLGGKEVVTADMKEELFRARIAIEKAQEGKVVSLVSSGDPQVYGMASPTMEMMCRRGVDLDVEVVPGVTAATAAAAKLGAPLAMDFAAVSLSDLLTPREEILRKVDRAAEADFELVFYNPISHSLLKEAMQVVSKYRVPSTPVGLVRGVYRPEEKVILTTLGEWQSHLNEVNMVTTLIVGNSRTYVCNGRMITPRGYDRRYRF